jgi:hypothetical protein
LNSHYPIKVEPLELYQLLITFDNKEQRMFDVVPYLSDDFFAPLRQIQDSKVENGLSASSPKEIRS